MQFHDNGMSYHADLSSEDVATLLRAVLTSDGRIKKIKLSNVTVWMKRQGTEKPIWWRHMQAGFAKLLPFPFMRPSLILSAEGMNAREIATIDAFKQKGFQVPDVLYRAPRVVVLGDVGPSVADRLWPIRTTDPLEHEALIIRSVDALGRIHAAGLCHGRPHVRDFFVRNGEIGFFDFEERPEQVMALAVAQARDLWLLLLTTSTISLDVQKTFESAFQKWRLHAPEATQAQLRQMIAILGRFLPFVRLIGRVRMGSDLRRFILATEFLKTALETDAAPDRAGKAGKDDRT